MQLLPYVFIAMGRSGTTWVAEVMNRHPCVYNAREQACATTMKYSTRIDPGAGFNRRWDDLLPSGAYFDLGTPAMPCEQFENHWHYKDGSAFHVCTPGAFGVRAHAAKVEEKKMREAASSCAAFAIGGKCQPDRDLNNTNTTAFEALLRSQTPAARVVYMVRNNSLDWVIAAGNAKGSHKRAVKVDAEHFARMVHKKRAHDEQDFRAMRDAAARARVPFLSLVYEELCADRRKLHALFQFLGVADDSDDARAMTAALVTADGDKRAKVHARTHRQEFGNYDEVKAAFEKVGLERYLQDETCSVTPSPSIALQTEARSRTKQNAAAKRPRK